MKTTTHLSRRDFLKTTGYGATAISALSGTAPAFASTTSANETIGIGHIGVGVRGGSLVNNVVKSEGAKVVAVCDVYKPHVEKGVSRSENPEVKSYVDYQDLLADKNVEAVVIATPDHWHSKMLIDAAEAGKDVYIEKGWTRTVPEAKTMLEAVKKNGTVMQLGHQGRSSTAMHKAGELIRDGVLGPVSMVRTGRFGNRPAGQAQIWRWYGWYSHYDRPDPDQVLRDLDWERWLGPAAKIPFSMEHFWHWRCYWEYGTGVAGDLLSHEMDCVQTVLGWGIPDACSSMGQVTIKDGRETPDVTSTTYHFEDKGCTVTFDSNMSSEARSQTPVFRGREALLRLDSIGQGVGNFEVVAESTSAKYREKIGSGEIERNKPFLHFDPESSEPRPSHMQDFLNCVRDRGKPQCNADEAFIEAITFLMSVESYQQQRVVRWDREKEEIV